MRHVTPAGLALIKRFEGFSAIPYLDSAGLATIGYGHLIKAGESYDCLSESEAESLLMKDLQVAERGVLRWIHVPLSDFQFDALVSFTFNLGVGALQRSTLRQKINRFEYEEAADEFDRWVFVKGIEIKGLMRRRAVEKKHYLA